MHDPGAVGARPGSPLGSRATNQTGAAGEQGPCSLPTDDMAELEQQLGQRRTAAQIRVPGLKAPVDRLTGFIESRC